LGIQIEFQGAKEALTGRLAGKSPDLTDAVEQFAFSRLSLQKRIALVLAGVFKGTPEQFMEASQELVFYAETDFAVPYKEPRKALDITMADVIT
jgi:hypothetical protein